MTILLSDPRIAAMRAWLARRLLLASDRLPDCAQLDRLTSRLVAPVATATHVA